MANSPTGSKSPTPVPARSTWGWFLTDDENFDILDPESIWVFPPRTIAAGGRLIVFASGKNRRPVGAGELHTNFQLAAGGEFLALVKLRRILGRDFVLTRVSAAGSRYFLRLRAGGARIP